jgi:hypothetical protein
VLIHKPGHLNIDLPTQILEFFGYQPAAVFGVVLIKLPFAV